MLSDDFVDWWFRPWQYAAEQPARWRAATSEFARRDGYRLWCADAGIAADLPAVFDPGWQQAAAGGAPQLLAQAALFAGLTAARAHDLARLNSLSLADRKWCVSVAATQPLHTLRPEAFSEGDTLAVCGLVELARRLEPAFPGLWPRLQLMLPAALGGRIEQLLGDAGELTESSPLRAQRCWKICCERIAQNGVPEKFASLLEQEGGRLPLTDMAIP